MFLRTVGWWGIFPAKILSNPSSISYTNRRNPDYTFGIRIYVIVCMNYIVRENNLHQNICERGRSRGRGTTSDLEPFY